MNLQRCIFITFVMRQFVVLVWAVSADGVAFLAGVDAFL
jgi:hypothetical protein